LGGWGLRPAARCGNRRRRRPSSSGCSASPPAAARCVRAAPCGVGGAAEKESAEGRGVSGREGGGRGLRHVLFRSAESLRRRKGVSVREGLQPKEGEERAG
jgi:hypothetical protein